MIVRKVTETLWTPLGENIAHFCSPSYHGAHDYDYFKAMLHLDRQSTQWNCLYRTAELNLVTHISFMKRENICYTDAPA